MEVDGPPIAETQITLAPKVEESVVTVCVFLLFHSILIHVRTSKAGPWLPQLLPTIEAVKRFLPREALSAIRCVMYASLTRSQAHSCHFCKVLVSMSLFGR